MWKAPELLRDPYCPPQGTPKGDVYSFAIILYEIHGRAGPWGHTPYSAKGTTLGFLVRVKKICRICTENAEEFIRYGTVNFGKGRWAKVCLRFHKGVVSDLLLFPGLLNLIFKLCFRVFLSKPQVHFSDSQASWLCHGFQCLTVIFRPLDPFEEILTYSQSSLALSWFQQSRELIHLWLMTSLSSAGNSHFRSFGASGSPWKRVNVQFMFPELKSSFKPLVCDRHKLRKQHKW